MGIKGLIAKYGDYIVKTRREFHRIPEESGKEFETSAKIKEKLGEMGLAARGIAGAGLIVVINGTAPGRTVALRADIDGLSVREESGAEFASEHEGFMHACGHDAHIAMLLGAARILLDAKSELNGSVRLLFQPAEEGGGGAKLMIKEGALDGVDTVFGLHVWSGLPSGTISVEAGPRMASADFFHIDIKGMGSHGAMPEQGIDAIVVGAAIVNSLQTIASRELSPLEPVVVTIGEFKAGTRNNVIAGEAYLSGTSRTFDNEIRDRLPDIISRIVENTAAAFRAEASVRYNKGASVVINDAACSETAADAVRDVLGRGALVSMVRTPTGEDFAEYQKIVPGTFGFLGVRNQNVGAIYPQHSSRYTIDESALPAGAGVAAQYALNYLRKR
ncbi:MAG: amidohydrolase [Synergistaceae bacterium]|jgi:amidohydrolase|nr:amidohydrolase [Synergistaceae bacterium]